MKCFRGAYVQDGENGESGESLEVVPHVPHFPHATKVPPSTRRETEKEVLISAQIVPEESFTVDPAHIIGRLRAAGCRLIPEGEQLRVKHPNALTDELRALIRQHKRAILDLLRQEQRKTADADYHSPASDQPQPPEERPPGPQPVNDEVGVQLELACDRIVERFLEEFPAWKTSPDLVFRYDRQEKVYLLGLKPVALQAFSQYVATCTTFSSAAERDHYAAMIKWLADHRGSRFTHELYRSANVPSVLPNQLRLF
jgi:hypothetical protein